MADGVEQLNDSIEASSSQAQDDASWIIEPFDYKAIRKKLDAKWTQTDQNVSEDLEKVERVISLLTARRLAGSSEPPVEQTSQASAAPPGLPPSIPVEAAMESGQLNDVVIDVADDLSLEAWSPETERLYDDVLYLFESGDLDGALVSLERLLLLAGRNPEVREFVTLNEDKLLKLYARSIGAMETSPQRERRAEAMPMSFLQRPSVARVFNAVNGDLTIAELIATLEMPALEVCAVLNQLRRSRLISCG